VTIVPAPRAPTGWRAAARRLLARLRRDRGATEAAAFDTAERLAYEAEVALWNVSLAPPAASSPLPADSARPIQGPAAAPGAPVLPPVLPTLPSPLLEVPFVSSGEPPAHVSATAPDLLLRTPSSVTSVADDFFDSLIRHVESDR
jgi:hypothetical protein